MSEDRPERVRVKDLPKITMALQPSSDAPDIDQLPPDGDGHVPYANFRIVSKAEYGGNLLFGTTWFDPGVDIGEYSNGVPGLRGYGPADYAFYVIRGKLHLTFSNQAGESGSLDVAADEGVRLPVGWTYGLSNPFEEPLYLVYAMTPAEV
jgi:hypothetical protein